MAAGVPAKEAEPALEPRPIHVMGREILTKRPTPEQLVIIEEVYSEIVRQEQGGDYETGKLTIKEFYRVIPGLFVRDEDAKWLDDGRYSGKVSMYEPEVLRIPEQIIEAWKDTMAGAPQNRAEKRAAARKKA